MKLSELKINLNQVSTIKILDINNHLIPAHFHITEIGQIVKSFIDCGGEVRSENSISFQIWYANDVEHRLAPQKLVDIISLAENKLSLKDSEVEIEYQGNTIEKYSLGFIDGQFKFLAKQTNCLAQDKCGIPPEKLKLNLADIEAKAEACCGPNSKCC